MIHVTDDIVLIIAPAIWTQGFTIAPIGQCIINSTIESEVLTYYLYHISMLFTNSSNTNKYSIGESYTVVYSV